MKKGVAKALKRHLKKKRRITDTLIIAFLITGNVSYGSSIEIPVEDISGQLAIKNDDTTIEIRGTVIDSYEFSEGTDDITELIYEKSGNGVIFENPQFNGKINNSGKLKGNISIKNLSYNVSTSSPWFGEQKYAELTGVGNGIYRSLSTQNLIVKNNGMIMGEAKVNTNIEGTDLTSSDLRVINTGNGIYSNAVVETNSGIIKGEVRSIGGDVIDPNFDLTNLPFSSGSFVNLSSSGNGVYGKVKINSGMIAGKVNAVSGTVQYSDSVGGSSENIVEFSGNGVYGGVQKNEGIIMGELEIISNNVTINDTLYGTSSSSSSNNGNGILMTDEIIQDNFGIISGSLKQNAGNSTQTSHTGGEDSGNGVLGNINLNSGIIEGKINSISKDTTKLSQYAGSSVVSGRSGNGVYNSLMENTGRIEGGAYLKSGNYSSSNSDVYTRAIATGNGLYVTAANITDTKNYGILKGTVTTELGYFDNGGVNETGYILKRGSGNGVVYEDLSKELLNKGLISGSESAVAILDPSGVTGNIENYGILAGREIIGDGTEIILGDTQAIDVGGDGSLDDVDLNSSYKNYGVEIKFNNDGERSILSVANGLGGTDEEGKVILNTLLRDNNTDSYNVVNIDTDYNDHIINGAGVNSGTLTINNSKVTLNNSIVNGYKKAVTLNGESSLTATNTVFNGGGTGTWNKGDNLDDYLKYTNVIEGDSGDNTILLQGSSILNGSAALGDGEDIMSISSATQLNGDLDGGLGSDSLTLGDTELIKAKGTGENLSIFGDVKGFEDINIKGGVTLYETAKVEGAEKINIESNSSLNLRIDPAKTDDTGRVTGHGLYGSNAVITTTENTEEGIEADTDGGAFNIITNGLGVGGVIAMSDDSGNQVTFEDNSYIRTDSIITIAEINENADIKISVGEDLDKVFSPLVPIDPADPVDPIDPVDPVEPVDPIEPVDPVDPIGPDKPDRPDFVSDGHYEKLDLIYKSIVSSGDNINALYPTVNTNDKSMDLAGENLLLLLNDIFMANPSGYTARTSKDSMGLFNEMVLNNPFRANEGNWMVYGGLTFGGDDYDSNYKNYIKGDYYGFDTYGVEVSADSSTYGGYALAEYGLDKNTSVGFILGGANSNTDISNGSKIDGDSIYVGAYAKSEINNFKLTAGLGYQYGNYDTIRAAGNKYQYNKYEEGITTDGFSAYTGLSYDYALNSKWSLEPKFNLVYSRVTQDSISEEGILSIETDKESFNYIDTEIGMDLVRKISLDSGEGKFRLGLSYVYALEGSDADYVTGRFQGGSDFDILVPERDKGTSKIKASYDAEYKSGIVYSVGGGYLPSENRDEYYGSVGVGFKFNNLKDFVPAKN